MANKRRVQKQSSTEADDVSSPEITLLQRKIVLDYEKLRRVVEVNKELGHQIVLTIGSWDMLHIGHVRYLLQARRFGDRLIVAADSDRAIKLYKGEDRPIIPERERLEMLSYQAPIDFVTLIDDVDKKGRWQYKLIRIVRPNVFVAVEDSYPPKQIRNIKRYCDKLVILPRQAETSTSKKIQDIAKGRLTQELLKFVKKIEHGET